MERPLCYVCHKNLARKRYDVPGKFKGKCAKCHRNGADKWHPYKTLKGLVCEICSFEPQHPCQLDVDHINGDHKDNRPENLRTLCANCHRLKTYMNKENRPKALRPL